MARGQKYPKNTYMTYSSSHLLKVIPFLSIVLA